MRDVWLAVLAAQTALGLEVPSGDPVASLEAYRSARDDVDLASIKAREVVTRHDVKAGIEEYNHLAGRQDIHLGLTSADVVDNVAQMQVAASLRAMARHHHLPGLEAEADALPMRGIKGAVGTQQDQADLLGPAGAMALDSAVASALGFSSTLISVGQVYHRSLDLQACSAALSATLSVAGPSPWVELARGYLSMVAAYQGDTWNEGDVSQSVVRRVALPGLFMSCSAALTACGRTGMD